MAQCEQTHVLVDDTTLIAIAWADAWRPETTDDAGNADRRYATTSRDLPDRGAAACKPVVGLAAVQQPTTMR